MKNDTIEYSEELLVHFDIEDHRLTIDEFYETAKTIQIITDSFNEILFESKPIIGVFVRPPKEGGIIEVLDFVVKHPISSWFIAQYGGEFLEGILKDLTGKDIEELGTALSAETRKCIKDLIDDSIKDYRQIKIDIPIGLKLLKDTVITFLKKESKDIYALQKSVKIPIEASIAKSKFYTMCAKSGRIKGIGFSKEHNFPIKQSDFVKHIVAEPIKTDQIQRRYELHDVTIIAPVNVEDSNVQWKTKDNNTGKRVGFFMADDKFRKEFFGGLYPLKETKKDDKMLVYVEYMTIIHPNGKKFEKRQAIKVFRFNNKDIEPVPEAIKLNTKYLSPNPKQGLLFDDENNN